jgi:hypothetical protein
VVDVMMVSRELRLYRTEWQEDVIFFFPLPQIHHLENLGSSSNCTQGNMFSTGIFLEIKDCKDIVVCFTKYGE